MKKLLYIGAMSTLLLTACGEAEKPIPENKTIEYPLPSDQAKKDTELKAKEEEEQKAKEAEGKVLAEKEVKVEPEAIADAEITVNEVKEIIEYSGMGEGDKLVNLNVGNGEIKAVIDLAPSPFNFPAKDLAVTSYQMASDELLTVEGWNTLTIEYVGVGTISMNVSEKESNEFNMYYFPATIITEKIK
ncbi:MULTISPECIES: hypothetical protein [unclassified Lysinibacillus]|uniref:hypothetical protein n=1 Tax=unclassified Lysinibacillus TaxID=2636778 RepID=UPI0037FCB87B